MLCYNDHVFCNYNIECEIYYYFLSWSIISFFLALYGISLSSIMRISTFPIQFKIIWNLAFYFLRCSWLYNVFFTSTWNLLFKRCSWICKKPINSSNIIVSRSFNSWIIAIALYSNHMVRVQNFPHNLDIWNNFTIKFYLIDKS